MVDIGVAAAVFAITFLAELPDKSLFASLVLGTRYRPGYVWVGTAAAFAVHVTIAVAAGQVLVTLVPSRLKDAIVAGLFVAVPSTSWSPVSGGTPMRAWMRPGRVTGRRHCCALPVWASR